MLVCFNFQLISQQTLFSNLRIDANINYANKKRSYAVYDNNKYANSGFLIGWDLSLHYLKNKYDIGLEMYPYRHFNAMIGYNIYRTDNNYSNELRVTPNIKLGYSPLLKKVYYGAGFKVASGLFTFGYNKIIHVKSGKSKYYGDGLDCLSIGITLYKGMFKKNPEI